MATQSILVSGKLDEAGMRKGLYVRVVDILNQSYRLHYQNQKVELSPFFDCIFVWMLNS